MKTTFILHGGETKIKNEQNKRFYQSWIESFDDDYIPTILLVYFAREVGQDARRYKEDLTNFQTYNNNRKANFMIADRDLNLFKQQTKDVDVIYFRGGSSDLLIKTMGPLKNELIDLIQGKVYVGSSAGVMLLSKYAHSHASDLWKRGFELFPWVSFVHKNSKIS